MADVKIYGADWCGPTAAAKRHIADLGVQYEYINIEQDANAARWVADQNDGKERKPTIDVDGTILSEPTIGEIDRALEEHGLVNAR